jgi:hypothetical protein
MNASSVGLRGRRSKTSGDVQVCYRLLATGRVNSCCSSDTVQHVRFPHVQQSEGSQRPLAPLANFKTASVWQTDNRSGYNLVRSQCFCI